MLHLGMTNRLWLTNYVLLIGLMALNGCTSNSTDGQTHEGAGSSESQALYERALDEVERAKKADDAYLLEDALKHYLLVHAHIGELFTGHPTSSQTRQIQLQQRLGTTGLRHISTRIMQIPEQQDFVYEFTPLVMDQLEGMDPPDVRKMWRLRAAMIYAGAGMRERAMSVLNVPPRKTRRPLSESVLHLEDHARHVIEHAPKTRTVTTPFLVSSPRLSRVRTGKLLRALIFPRFERMRVDETLGGLLRMSTSRAMMYIHEEQVSALESYERHAVALTYRELRDERPQLMLDMLALIERAQDANERTRMHLIHSPCQLIDSKDLQALEACFEGEEVLFKQADDVPKQRWLQSLDRTPIQSALRPHGGLRMTRAVEGVTSWEAEDPITLGFFMIHAILYEWDKVFEASWMHIKDGMGRAKDLLDFNQIDLHRHTPMHSLLSIASSAMLDKYMKSHEHMSNEDLYETAMFLRKAGQSERAQRLLDAFLKRVKAHPTWWRTKQASHREASIAHAAFIRGDVGAMKRALKRVKRALASYTKEYDPLKVDALNILCILEEDIAQTRPNLTPFIEKTLKGLSENDRLFMQKRRDRQRRWDHNNVHVYEASHHEAEATFSSVGLQATEHDTLTSNPLAAFIDKKGCEGLDDASFATLNTIPDYRDARLIEVGKMCVLRGDAAAALGVARMIASPDNRLELLLALAPYFELSSQQDVPAVRKVLWQIHQDKRFALK